MLAKEIRMQKVLEQIEFIKEALLHAALTRKDDKIIYSYVGDIYSEVVTSFEEEGFIITKIDTDTVTAKTSGMPIYIFSAGDHKLTSEEVYASRESHTSGSSVLDESKARLGKFINDLFGQQ